jgi:prepilin-type N-terminal cleavage/methylation domain-containing protein
MNKNKGFTLIEVLTVIMIIAILASIILVSLDTARERTRDVTIQNQIGQLRSLAEALYTFEEHYNEFADAKDNNADEYRRVAEKVNEMGGELKVEFLEDVQGNKRAYCAYSKLASDEEEAFCVDSTGNAMTGVFATIESSCGDSYVCEETGGTSTGCTTAADCGDPAEDWTCHEGDCYYTP